MSTPSRLHQHAVGFIWEVLTNGNPDMPCFLVDDEGETHDLRSSMGTVNIPSSLQPIQGLVPDLAIFDDTGKVKVIIEIIVTNPPDRKKKQRLDNLRKQGVVVILKTVNGWDDLTTLVRVPIQYEPRNWSWGDVTKWQNDDGSRAIARFGPSSVDLLRIVISAIKLAPPEMRRELIEVLDEARTPASLAPLGEKNPFRGT